MQDYAVGVPSWPGENNANGSEEVSHMLFASPWRGKSIIGTFHSHYLGDPNNFSVQEIDLQKIVQEANSAYPGAQLEMDDIKFVHFGFLPEVSEPSQQEVKLVRKSRIVDHHAENGLSGLISVMGVKYTTARHTAEKVVDLVNEKLELKSLACKTSSTRVVGGQINKFGEFLSRAIQEDLGVLTPESIEHWVQSYGTEYSKVRELLADLENQMPYTQLSEPVLKAQVKYAVREEMAIKLSDVVLRRTGIGTVGQPDDSILEVIASTMASELGWSSAKVELEIEEVRAFYFKHGLGNLVVEDLVIS